MHKNIKPAEILDKNGPVVAAWRIPGGIHLVFRCPWCGELHYHGSGGRNSPFGAGDGGRVSHCRKKESEKYFGGYILREVQDWRLAGNIPKELRSVRSP